MTQITVVYSGGAFSATQGAPVTAAESPYVKNLAFPLGQAGFDFSGVPAGYGVQLAGVRVSGSWSGMDAGSFGVSGLSLLHVQYGGSYTYFQMPSAYSPQVGNTLAVFGAFAFTPAQEASIIGLQSYCPTQNIVLGIGSRLAGLTVMITDFALTFDLVPNGCAGGGGGGTTPPAPAPTVSLFNAKRAYHPHTRRVLQSGLIQMPNGYAPGVNLAALFGGLAGTELWEARARGFANASVRNDVLHVYGANGAELASGDPSILGVDILRMGF